MIGDKIHNKSKWCISLRDHNGEPQGELPLNVIDYSTQHLSLKCAANSIAIHFSAKTDKKYLSLRLEKVEGVETHQIFNIKASVDGIENLRVVPLDYTSRTNDLNITQTAQETPSMEDLYNENKLKSKTVIAEIPFLWARKPSDPMGGFVFYKGNTEEEEEEVFYKIWVEENLPHPKVNGEWTVEKAKEWVADWKEKCGTYSELYILPEGPEDLKPLAQETKKLGIKNVYLHCDVWRGAFWPMDTEIFHVNQKFFPEGRKDLNAYGRYLEDEGLGMVTRIVSGSIGPEHPRYMKPRPHEGISTWLRGDLHADISKEDTEFTLSIHPGQDTWSGYWDESTTMELATIAIGDELIKIAKVEKESDHLWKVQSCERGAYSTEAADHKANADFRWLKTSYGFIFVPEPHHPLFQEFIQDYVNFVNENRLAVANYDGLEIHRVDPFGANMLLEETYRRIDHPVRANTSGGIPRWGYFQYRLPSVLKYTGRDKPLFFKHQLGIFKIGLHQDRWSASGPYDYCYAFVPEVVHGGPISIQANKGFHNLDIHDFKAHGLIDLYRQELNAWFKIGRNLPDNIKKRIRDAQYRRSTPIGPEQWPCMDEQFRLSRKDGKESVEPFQVLKRKDVDRPFCNGQEFGLVSPKQYILPGDIINLQNPYGEQTPELIIKTLSAFDHNKTSGFVEIKEETDAEAEYNEMLDLFQGASLVTIEDDGHKSFAGSVNYSIQPKAEDITDVGRTAFEQNGDVLRMSLNNDSEKDYLQVHWDKDTLPRYSVLSSFEKAGGLEVTVDGDGSGAILVVRVQACGFRDYVIPIDFFGKQKIEIPSPECSYSEGRWRWMPAYKRLRGGPVTEVRLGFAMVPEKTNASVTIENMRFLPEVDSSLNNPKIVINGGLLQILGQIPSGHNLWYKGGDSIGVYNLNWHKVKDLPVTKDSFLVKPGDNQFSIHHEGKEMPWLECQCIAADHDGSYVL